MSDYERFRCCNLGDTMEISSRIFELIKKKGLTQKAFSKMTNIPESTISDWKNKKLNPSVDKINSICRALEVTPSYLLGYEEKVEDANASDYVVDGADDERFLIESYRKADLEIKNRVISFLSSYETNRLEHNNRDELINSLTRSNTNGNTEQIESDYELTSKKILAKKLRRLARLERIKLDETEHVSGFNLHLFKYLDYLEMDKLEFIKNYLQHIQPFMIAEIKSQEKFENAICVLDEYYRISVYIKVDSTKNEEIIVSFHENNKNGIAKRNSVIIKEKYVYVFADSIGSHVIGTNNYSINVFITRGVRTFPISISAKGYDDEGFIARYSDIENALTDIVNDYLADLYTSDLDFESIELFSSLQQLSFTSYGHDVFSNISLLVDSILIQKDPISKQIADSAMCIYCSSLIMLDADKKELLSTLSARFSVNSVRALPEIMNRISTYIAS